MDIKVEKCEYGTKSGISDCIYKNKIHKIIKFDDYMPKKNKSVIKLVKDWS